MHKKTKDRVTILTEWFVIRVIGRMQHVEQKLLTTPEYQSLLPVFREDRVARSLVSCVVLCISLAIPMSFFHSGHCVVCSPIYGF